MAEIQLDDAPQKAKDFFNKGFAAFERGSLDYAMDLLTSSVEICPGLLQARKFLRAAEVKRFKEKKGGSLTHVVSLVKGLPDYLRTAKDIKSGKGTNALASAEKLLRVDPLNVHFILMFADATVLAGLPEAGVQTLEMARGHYPADVSVEKRLGELYQEAGRPHDARSCFEKLCEASPNDPALIKALKDAMALDSMRGDGWAEASETGGTYREMIRDTKEAQLLEQESKAVKTATDVDALIEDTLAKIEAEPENINYYRAVARLYVQKKMFDAAVTALRKASEISSGDPEIDAALARVRAQQFDHDIEQLREAGDEATLEAKETERAQFIFDNLQERVTRYPNDLGLRYDWGVALFENDYFNEAIQQFQMAQRSPQHRTNSLYYLGLCFKQKKQYDLAAEQLESAAAGLAAMDDTKKEIVYELGAIAEALGDSEKSARHYKQIYQVDIGFRDVAQKVEQVYE